MNKGGGWVVRKLTCVREVEFFDALDIWVSTGRFILYLVSTEDCENTALPFNTDLLLTQQDSALTFILRH